MHTNVHCDYIYNSQDMKATEISIDRWIDKEVVVHLHYGILPSHKKGQIWVSGTEVSELRTCYTEKAYFQGKTRDPDVENGLVDTAREGEGGTNWESSIEIYPLPCAK